MFEA